MKNRFFLLYYIFVFVFCDGSAGAQERGIDSLVGADLKEKLLSRRCLTEVHFDDFNLDFIPDDNLLKNVIENSKREVVPSIIIEGACVYKKPGSSGKWTVAERVKLFNGIASFSTLEGLEYFSPSRKAMRVFYEISYVIDSPESKKRLPDPVFTEKNLPQHLSVYAIQKDWTFGENIYRNDFKVCENEIIFIQENLTKMHYKIFPVLNPAKLRTIISVINAGDYIFIYMASMANVLSFPGLKSRIGASFSARLEAVLNWFTGKAGAVYN